MGSGFPGETRKGRLADCGEKGAGPTEQAAIWQGRAQGANYNNVLLCLDPATTMYYYASIQLQQCISLWPKITDT